MSCSNGRRRRFSSAKCAVRATSCSCVLSSSSKLRSTICRRARSIPAGLALRFARVKGYRPDKRAEDADTMQTLQDIYRTMTGVMRQCRGLTLPELPDVELYLSALRPRIVGQTLERVRLATPFLLRSVEPPLDAREGQTVAGFRRIGKRIVWEMEVRRPELDKRAVSGLSLDDRRQVQMARSGRAVPRKVGLAAFDFARGTLLLTEVATQKRASLHVVRGEEALASFDPGGLEVMTSSRRIRRGAAEGKPHAEARAHRSASVQRHRQRILRRDSASREALAVQAHAPVDRRRDRGLHRGNARDARRVDGPAAGRRRR